MRRGPDHVVVGEEYRRTFIERLRASSKPSFLRHEEVQNDLLISSPITAIRKHEYSLNLGFSKITLPGMFLLVLCELPEWCRVHIVLDNISWRAMVLSELALLIHEDYSKRNMS